MPYSPPECNPFFSKILGNKPEDSIEVDDHNLETTEIHLSPENTWKNIFLIEREPDVLENADQEPKPCQSSSDITELLDSKKVEQIIVKEGQLRSLSEIIRKKDSPMKITRQEAEPDIMDIPDPCSSNTENEGRTEEEHVQVLSENIWKESNPIKITRQDAGSDIMDITDPCSSNTDNLNFNQSIDELNVNEPILKLEGQSFYRPSPFKASVVILPKKFSKAIDKPLIRKKIVPVAKRSKPLVSKSTTLAVKAPKNHPKKNIPSTVRSNRRPVLEDDIACIQVYVS